jgi:amidase
MLTLETVPDARARSKALKRISRDKYTTVLDQKIPPAATLKPGEEVLVETYDAFMGHWGVGQWPEHLGAATGPIAIEGAAPGDALRIDLLDVVPVELQPGRGAVHHTSDKLGFLAREFDKHYPVVMAIEDGHLIHPKGIRIPLRPSLGFIGTTYTEPRKTSSDSGPYGGDIDMKELAPGSTIWLPVFVPGALLCLGDVHAVLGDAAVGGTAAEAAGEVTIRVSLEKNSKIKRPRVLTPDHFITCCYGEDVGEAMRQAVRDMVDFLSIEKGMEPYDAYGLLSLAGDVRINRTFRPISPVKMMLSRDVLRQVETAYRK